MQLWLMQGSDIIIPASEIYDFNYQSTVCTQDAVTNAVYYDTLSMLTTHDIKVGEIYSTRIKTTCSLGSFEVKQVYSEKSKKRAILKPPCAEKLDDIIEGWDTLNEMINYPQFARFLGDALGLTILGMPSDTSALITVKDIKCDMSYRQALTFLAEYFGYNIHIIGENAYFERWNTHQHDYSATDIKSLEISDFDCQAVDKVVASNGGVKFLEYGDGDVIYNTDSNLLFLNKEDPNVLSGIVDNLGFSYKAGNLSVFDIPADSKTVPVVLTHTVGGMIHITNGSDTYDMICSSLQITQSGITIKSCGQEKRNSESPYNNVISQINKMSNSLKINFRHIDLMGSDIQIGGKSQDEENNIGKIMMYDVTTDKPDESKLNALIGTQGFQFYSNGGDGDQEKNWYGRFGKEVINATGYNGYGAVLRGSDSMFTIRNSEADKEGQGTLNFKAYKTADDWTYGTIGCNFEFTAPNRTTYGYSRTGIIHQNYKSEPWVKSIWSPIPVGQRKWVGGPTLYNTGTYLIIFDVEIEGSFSAWEYGFYRYDEVGGRLNYKRLTNGTGITCDQLVVLVQHTQDTPGAGTTYGIFSQHSGSEARDVWAKWKVIEI